MTMPQHILFCLQKSDVPISGPELVRRCGGELSHARSRVWHVLQQLHLKNLIQKTFARSPVRFGRGNGQRITYWTLQ